AKAIFPGKGRQSTGWLAHAEHQEYYEQSECQKRCRKREQARRPHRHAALLQVVSFRETKFPTHFKRRKNSKAECSPKGTPSPVRDPDHLRAAPTLPRSYH